MNARAAVIHVAVAVAIGALVAALTPARWLAASLWVSAAMFINGSLAVVEDAQPGGFDNPHGSEALPVAKGASGTRVALQSVAIAVALAGLGFVVQFV